jgi:sporulation integral membrane protein YlbJ
MNFLRILIILSVLLAMLTAPAAALSAAQSALETWWSKVLPALLPFFIISELCSRTGLIRALSIWLTPIMQPLFRLPGAAALGVILGFFSGSPTGGTIAGELRRERLISRNEGERLLAFTNNAGPLYILITVAATLNEPQVGLWLALAHYPLNLLFGLLLRFFAKSAEVTPPQTCYKSATELWLAGLNAIKTAPKQPFSLILKESSLKALTNIGMIGAFMLCFSLLLLMLRRTGLLKLLQICLLPLCHLFDLPESVLPALSEGFFEMTIGINTLGESAAPLFAKLLAASVILSWSGISIHSQISGVISDCDLSLKYYLPCRILHCIAAPLLLLKLQNQFDISTSAAHFAANLPPCLLIPGALLLPSIILLGILLLIAFFSAAQNGKQK